MPNNDKETFESAYDKLYLYVKHREALNTNDLKEIKQLHNSDIRFKDLTINQLEMCIEQIHINYKEEKDSELQTKEMLLNTAQTEINRLLLLTEEKDKEIHNINDIRLKQFIKLQKEHNFLIIQHNIQHKNKFNLLKQISELQAENERKTKIIKKYQENDE